MKAIGKIDWAIASGKIPERSTGEEPEFISHDKVAILNTSNKEVTIEMFIFYENEPPVGPFEVTVDPCRLKKIRFNDLIDPVAIRLERSFSCYIRTTGKVVVQFSRLNSGIAANAEMNTMAFPVDD